MTSAFEPGSLRPMHSVFCRLDADLVERLLRQGVLRVEDVRCLDDCSATVIRERVLLSCMGKSS